MLKEGVLNVDSSNITDNRKLRKKRKIEVDEVMKESNTGLSEKIEDEVKSGNATETGEEERSNDVLTQNDESMLNILTSLLSDNSSYNISMPTLRDCSTEGLINTSTNNSLSVDIPAQEEEIEGPTVVTTAEGRIEGYFCSDVVFNLSRRVLTDIEIKVLEKGLGYVPTPSRIDEAQLREDFNDFARKMRCKWFFRDEISQDFSDIPAFRPKSNWNPPKGHLCLELFLSTVEEEIFSLLPGKATSFNLSKEEWKAMRGLKEDSGIIIKSADKGSCVVVWDRSDYLEEGRKQLEDRNTYEEVKFDSNDLSGLVRKSNEIFRKLYSRKTITEKELTVSTFCTTLRTVPT